MQHVQMFDSLNTPNGPAGGREYVENKWSPRMFCVAY